MGRVLVIAVLMLVGLASSVAASEGESGFINLDKSLLIQAVNFGLLLAVLWKFLYRPLLAKMDERTQAIRKSLEEAQAIRDAALKEAAEEQRRLVEAARAEAGRLVEGAKAELAQDVRRARQELRREVSDLAITVAERLIRKSLRDDDHRRIVEDEIARLQEVK